VVVVHPFVALVAHILAGCFGQPALVFGPGLGRPLGLVAFVRSA